jgi:predicted permease
MLLAGAGLLIRSFARLQNVPPGFAADHVISMRTIVTGPKYKDEKAVAQFFRDLGGRVARLPGVTAQGQVSVLPLTGAVGWGGINVEGFTPAPGQELQVDQRLASTDYFRTMKIPLLKGRYFDDHDTPETQAVAIIDAPFAQRFWPRENPIGKHLWFDAKKPFTIAGVVGMVKQYGLDAGSKLVVYFPQQQDPDNGMYVVARTTSDPAALAGAMVAEIHAVEPAAPVYEIRTMQERLHDSLARQRFATTMLGTFAALALLLAAVGVYGVVSYLVTQSTHDLGVRVALGAQSGHIVGLVVKQGMTLGAAGIGGGIIGAIALTRVMASLLFGVSATDFLTFGVVVAILGAVVLAATIIPARRAATVDPTVALREE